MPEYGSLPGTSFTNGMSVEPDYRYRIHTRDGLGKVTHFKYLGTRVDAEDR